MDYRYILILDLLTVLLFIYMAWARTVWNTALMEGRSFIPGGDEDLRQASAEETFELNPQEHAAEEPPARLTRAWSGGSEHLSRTSSRASCRLREDTQEEMNVSSSTANLRKTFKKVVFSTPQKLYPSDDVEDDNMSCAGREEDPQPSEEVPQDLIKSYRAYDSNKLRFLCHVNWVNATFRVFVISQVHH